MEGRPRAEKGALLGCAAVALAAAALYGRTIGFDFVYDDQTVVLGHPQVQSHDWVAIATSPYHVGESVRVETGAYRPLTIATLAANHAISGVNPWSYHLVNVLLHAAAAVFVFLLAIELRVAWAGALVAGLAFAVHPVHVEPVANVAGRAELLSTALALIALIAYLRGRLLRMAVLLCAALFSKENTVTITGVIALAEAFRLGPARLREGGARARAACLALISAAIPIAIYLAARYEVLGALGLAPGSVTPIENPIVGLAPMPRAATVLSVFVKAIALLVTPVRLSPDYGFAEIVPVGSLLSPAPLLGAILLAAMITAIAYSIHRAPLTAFCVGSILATYAIVSNAFVLIGTILGDRLLYLPSAFACVLLGAATVTAARRYGGGLAAAGTGAVLVALSARAAAYTGAWRNEASLFSYAARVAPRSVRALGGWGEILGEQGRTAEARAVLDRALVLAPDFIPNLLNRSAAALSAGDLDAAEHDARHVARLEPENAAAARLLSAIEARR
jgi:tetratricopeptide (TPR) repeat protein